MSQFGCFPSHAMTIIYAEMVSQKFVSAKLLQNLEPHPFWDEWCPPTCNLPAAFPFRQRNPPAVSGTGPRQKMWSEKWTSHLNQSSILQAVNNCSYQDCDGTCDFCWFISKPPGHIYPYIIVLITADTKSYQYGYGPKHLKALQAHSVRIGNSWSMDIPPRGSPPKPLPSAVALLRADVWLPRVLWRLPAGERVYISLYV